MSPAARVDSESPQRLSTAVRRLVADSDATSASAVTAVDRNLQTAQDELRVRQRRLDDARSALARAQSALAACQADPRANCGPLVQAVAERTHDVRRQETRVEAASQSVGEIRRQLDVLIAARARLAGEQTRTAEGAFKALSLAAANIEAYLTGTPMSGGISWDSGTSAVGSAFGGGSVGGGRSGAFSSEEAASARKHGFPTNAGHAYYAPRDANMIPYAKALKPFSGEYAVDMHGSPESVMVGDQPLNAQQLAEVIRHEPDWGGRPVRLFSCNTGEGADPIGQQLAHDLGVRVTAPVGRAVSNRHGDSWVRAAPTMQLVGGIPQMVPGPIIADGWRIFDP